MTDRNKIDDATYEIGLLGGYGLPIGETDTHDVHFIRCVRGKRPSSVVAHRPNPWSNPGE